MNWLRAAFVMAAILVTALAFGVLALTITFCIIDDGGGMLRRLAVSGVSIWAFGLLWSKTWEIVQWINESS